MRDYRKITENDLITLTSKGDLEAKKELRKRVATLENDKAKLDQDLNKLVGGVNAMVDLEDEFGDDLQVAALLAELKKITQGGLQ